MEYASIPVLRTARRSLRELNQVFEDHAKLPELSDDKKQELNQLIELKLESITDLVTEAESPRLNILTQTAESSLEVATKATREALKHNMN